MIDILLNLFSRFCLWLRYRVKLVGLEEISQKGTEGVLFLPNHPALIDPIIVQSQLQPKFKIRALADKDRINIPLIGWAARRSGAIPIPDVGVYGSRCKPEIQKALDTAAEHLKNGGNVLIYPAGHLKRTRFEEIGAASGLETLLENCPNCKIVLVRTTGLWGSSFGWAGGRRPSVGGAIKHGLVRLAGNLIFFSPRRKVTIEFEEAADFPRSADRDTINRYLEDFYNAKPEFNTYVPYSVFRGFKPRQMAEPQQAKITGDVDSVPPERRGEIIEHLKKLTGVGEITPQTKLAYDLGLDSLARVDLAIWLEQQYGFTCPDPESLVSVLDIMLASCGQGLTSHGGELRHPTYKWFAGDDSSGPLELLSQENLAMAFLRQARRNPRRVIIADQVSGEKTFRDIIKGVFALKSTFAELAGHRLGILMPASVTANIMYWAAVFSGKTPVMVNWTSGERNLIHSLDSTSVRTVISSRLVIEKLARQGVNLDCIKDRLVAIEDIVSRLGFLDKLKAGFNALFRMKSLAKTKVGDVAVILFTSGSESLPKAVPLTHTNIISNMKDCLQVAGFFMKSSDKILGILPPFHSFGLTVGIAFVSCAGIRCVYHPNPTEAQTLAKIIEEFKATLLVATPTFVSGILRACENHQLDSVRLGVTGAEKCPPRVYNQLREKCANAVIIEGYGITECSPIAALNDIRGPKPGTIGKVLPSLEYAIVDVDTFGEVSRGTQGLLLLRGPSVFGGYIHFDGPSPFVKFGEKEWYSTGDLVEEDADGVLVFKGRLKRFVKLGGEMISLPAIEAVLQEQYTTGREDVPVIAVVSLGTEEHPELVLVSTLDISQAQVNEKLRNAGLSGLHTIRRVIQVSEIPMLGTGKTDYRRLGQMLG